MMDDDQKIKITAHNKEEFERVEKAIAKFPKRIRCQFASASIGIVAGIEFVFKEYFGEENINISLPATTCRIKEVDDFVIRIFFSDVPDTFEIKRATQKQKFTITFVAFDSK